MDDFSWPAWVDLLHIAGAAGGRVRFRSVGQALAYSLAVREQEVAALFGEEPLVTPPRGAGGTTLTAKYHEQVHKLSKEGLSPGKIASQLKISKCTVGRILSAL